MQFIVIIKRPNNTSRDIHSAKKETERNRKKRIEGERKRECSIY